MRIAFAILFILAIAVPGFGAIESLKSSIGETYAVRLMGAVAAIAALLVTTIVMKVKGRGMASWRSFWLACAFICLTYSWYNWPAVVEDRLLKAAVDAEIHYQDVRETYPRPATPRELACVLRAEQQNKLHNLRYHDHYTMLRADPTTGSNRLAVFSLVVGVLCLGAALLPSDYVDRLGED